MSPNDELQPWDPWIGKHFNETGLLILGESAYRWWDEENQKFQTPNLSHSKELVESVFTGYFANFVACVTRGLAGEEWPSLERKEFVWHRVAFTNYVPGIVEGPRERPSKEQWEKAQDQWSERLEGIRPRRVVVLGRELWKHMPPTDFLNDPDEMWVQGYRLRDGSPVLCWGLPHPSGGLNWRTLAEVVQWWAFEG